MAHAVKVRRSGIEKIFGKVKPFRHWLNEQPRKTLTYRKGHNPSDLLGEEKTGWRTEDFVREAWARGLELRIGTVNKWLEGSQPRVMAMQQLRETFPTITF